MTPLEEKVRGILEKYGEFGQHALLKAILALIDGEVAAERERCASLIEDGSIVAESGNPVAKALSTAIRSSGEGK